jgi:tetratricopeptide (TPR) repeat protein
MVARVFGLLLLIALTGVAGLAGAEMLRAHWIAEADALMENPTASWTRSRDNHARAATLYGRAVLLSEIRFGPSSVETADVLEALAGALEANGDAAPAAIHRERALAILHEHLGSLSPRVFRSRFLLGDLSLKLGRYARAAELYQGCFAPLDEGWVAPPPVEPYRNPRLELMTLLGYCAERTGAGERASEWYEKVLERDVREPRVPAAEMERAFPDAARLYRNRETTPEAVDALVGLAGLARARGDQAQADALLTSAFLAWRPTGANDNWRILHQQELRDATEAAGLEVFGPIQGERDLGAKAERFVAAWTKAHP